MFPRVEDKEIEIIGIDKLASDLGEVVDGLDDRMPAGSSVVVQVNSTLPRRVLEEQLSHNHFVTLLLKQSPELQSRFPTRRKFLVTSPNTWLLGTTKPGNPPPFRYGLFSKLDGFYSSDYAGRILGLEGRSLNWSCFGHLHEGLDIEQLTGRTRGTVSVILERKYLRETFVIDFDHSLIRDLKLPDRLVDYPLGDARYYIARGEAFLSAYAQFTKDHGIRTNLSDSAKD